MHSKSFRSAVFLMMLCFSGVSFAASSAQSANPTTGGPVASKKDVRITVESCRKDEHDCTALFCSQFPVGEVRNACNLDCLAKGSKCRQQIPTNN
jgi:hypothetical protein